MNHREYEFSTRWNTNEDLFMKYIEATPRAVRDGYEIRYAIPDEHDWWPEISYESRAYFDKWIDAYDALTCASVKNGSDICGVKDLGEFNTDGTDVRSLFESCEVAHEK